MRRTHNYYIINKQTKKNKKKTVIGWKTFNSKKVRFIIPRLKKIIILINKVILNIMINKQKSIIKQITAMIKKQRIESQIKQNITISNSLKMNLYNSYFITEQKMIDVVDCQHIEKKSIITNKLYQNYLYVTSIINRIKEDKISVLMLPPKRTTYTVLRSPHADKKAREQFAKEIYTSKIIIDQYVSIMKYLNKIVYFYTKPFITSYKYKTIY